MLIPHLMFAHMLADYTLQTDWLVARKRQGWDGLLLHGGTVGFLSLLALAPYGRVVWLPLIVLTAVHTLQDYLKVTSGPRLHVHTFFPYMSDQLFHYLVIIGIQLWVGSRLSPEPPDNELAFMWIGTATITVTRFYDVTCWANWLDMLPYMNRWRWFGYAERLVILALAAVGLWFVAPVGVIPRLVISARRGHPIWREKHGLPEMALGAALSILLGLGLHSVLA